MLVSGWKAVLGDRTMGAWLGGQRATEIGRWAWPAEAIFLCSVPMSMGKSLGFGTGHI
jgi:hypothetical protein